MAREFAKAFYNSKAWIKTSKAYAASKFYLCEKCGKAGKIVHHKTHLSPENINNPTITLSWYNLQYLCLDCHNIIHGNDSTERKCMFDQDGNMVGVQDGPPR
ncbi:MAG: HNH endonuclease [Selenomonadaceae bacterium]